MNDIATRHEVSPNSASGVVEIIQVIERVAANPDADPDKMLRLLELQERIMDRQAAQIFNEAMNAAQEEMEPISRDASNSQTKSKYASYEALDRALRPIYTKHGFSLSFNTADGAPEAHVRVVCKVGHNCGRSEYPYVDMPADGKGAKGGDVMTKTHATMSAISYGKRGLLKMIFNIAECDDDGNAAAAPIPFITEEHVMDLRDLAESVGADLPKFLQFMKVQKLSEITADRFDFAVKALKHKAKSA